MYIYTRLSSLNITWYTSATPSLLIMMVSPALRPVERQKLIKYTESARPRKYWKQKAHKGKKDLV